MEKLDLIIVGGGAGGFAAATMASDLGETGPDAIADAVRAGGDVVKTTELR